MCILILGKWIMVSVSCNTALIVLEIPFAVNLYFFLILPLTISYRSSIVIVFTPLCLPNSFITVSKKWGCHFLAGKVELDLHLPYCPLHVQLQ